METMQAATDKERDLDDSGCVQDESLLSKQLSQCDEQRVNLMDMPDDVLLHIFQFCDACDLKALGFSCARLGALVLARRLWRRVDARALPAGKARVRWYIDRALHEGTTALYFRGYALQAKGCRGHVEYKRPEGPVRDIPPRFVAPAPRKTDIPTSSGSPPAPPRPVRQPAQLYIRASTSRLLPRQLAHPYWPDRTEVTPVKGPHPETDPCIGAQVSFTRASLRKLAVKCPLLTELSLEYCVIDARMTSLAYFPKTLKSLSLKGTKCYNLCTDKTFLFRINDHLPNLESVDVSSCAWLEPAALLALSRAPALRRLAARRCPRLGEFVAYASLVAVRGFRALQELDLSGCPLGDSEASSFGWLPNLHTLTLSAEVNQEVEVEPHAHYRGEPYAEATDLCDWELEEPSYYKQSFQEEDPDDPEPETEIEPEVAPRPQAEGTQVFTITFDRENGPRVENFIVPHGICDIPLQRPQEPADSNQAETTTNNHAPSIYDETNQSDNKTENSTVNNENSDQSDSDNDKNEKESDNDKDEKESDSDKGKKSNSDILYDIREYEFEGDESDDSFYSAKDVSSSFSNGEPVAGPSRLGDAQNGLGSDNKINEPSRNSPDSKPGCSGIQINKKEEAQGVKRAADADVDDPSPKKHKNELQRSVRFRRNLPPVVVIKDPSRPNVEIVEELPIQELNQAVNGNQAADQNPAERNGVSVQIANGQPSFDRQNPIERAIRLPCYNNIIFAPPPPRIAPSKLISDSTITSYGVSDVRNYVHIGPDGVLFGAQGNNHNKPSKSPLKRLICTGYSGITDVSLNHLLYAAPFLEYIDFSETNVSKECVDNFRASKPNCEVVFSKFQQK